MEEINKAEFEIQISSADATEDELARLTYQLLNEVKETDVESATLVPGGPAPKGTKGDPVTYGSIAIELIPAVLPSVIGLVQAWVTRGQGRTVKFKGKGIEFEGSPEELQKLLASLEKGKRKK